MAGTLLAGEVPAACGEVFNIGNPVESRIVEMAERIKRLTHSRSQVQFVPYEDYYGENYEDTRRRVPAIEKAERRLGFRPKVDLERGLRQTIAWCRKHYGH